MLDIQKEYPRAGRFRVHGLLEQKLGNDLPSETTIGRAMAMNRQFHGAPGPWNSCRDDAEPDTRVKTMPYQPQYRHHIWFIDLRYLVKLDDDWVSSLCVIDGYSRVILAGMASHYQDRPAVLQILFAAVSAYGCPERIVSDNGKVFHAQQYNAILKALHIAPQHIEQGKPWQNLIEAQFKIQLRLADFKFEHAATFEDIQRLHAEFIHTFNTTAHWTHRDREDGRRTPTQVLAWVRGPLVEIERRHHIFRQVQFSRTVNHYGFVSVQRFYLYVEQGLARRRVSIWIHEGHLQIEYQQTLLSTYHCQTDRRQQRLRNVTHPTLYRTPFGSPQLEFFELDDEQWRKVFPRPYTIDNRNVFPRKPDNSLCPASTSQLTDLIWGTENMFLLVKKTRIKKHFTDCAVLRKTHSFYTFLSLPSLSQSVFLLFLAQWLYFGQFIDPQQVWSYFFPNVCTFMWTGPKRLDFTSIVDYASGIVMDFVKENVIP